MTYNRNDLNERIKALMSADPILIIELFCANIDEGLINDVKRLYIDYLDVDTGIINAMLLFVLNVKNGYLQHYHYLADTLKKWMIHIKTTEDALLFITREKRFNQKHHRNQKDPDWLHDYLSDLEKLEG